MGNSSFDVDLATKLVKVFELVSPTNLSPDSTSSVLNQTVTKMALRIWRSDVSLLSGEDSSDDVEIIKVFHPAG